MVPQYKSLLSYPWQALAGADCEEPRLVLIDFGLAEGFLSTSSGCSGTAGYIPPETWETERWYPKGQSVGPQVGKPKQLGSHGAYIYIYICLQGY